MPAIIVMPADAPAVKVEGTRGRRRRDHLLRPPHREPRGHRRRASPQESGAIVVPSFDDPDDRRGAGHGRAGDPRAARASAGEDRRPVRRRRAGGGHRAGAARFARSSCVEPEGWDDMAPLARGGRDRAGRGRRAPTPSATRCRPRACRRSPSASSRSAGRARCAVSDDEVEEAMRFAWNEHQLVVEPGGAVALAALLAGKVEPSGSGRRAVGRECRSGASCADRRMRGLGGARSGMRRARPGPGSSARPCGQRLKLGRKRLELGGERRVGLRHAARTRRSGSPASWRCTAGSFPRSARTPRRDAPALVDRPSARVMSRSGLSLGEGECALETFSADGDGAGGHRRVPAGDRRDSPGAGALRPAAAAR